MAGEVMIQGYRVQMRTRASHAGGIRNVFIWDAAFAWMLKNDSKKGRGTLHLEERASGKIGS
jgi:hypothetical protein